MVQWMGVVVGMYTSRSYVIADMWEQFYVYVTTAVVSLLCDRCVVVSTYDSSRSYIIIRFTRMAETEKRTKQKTTNFQAVRIRSATKLTVKPVNMSYEFYRETSCPKTTKSHEP